MSKAAHLSSSFPIFAAAALAVLSGTMVGSSLPAIGCSLTLDQAASSSVMEAYFIPVGVLLPAAGGLGDRFGRMVVFAVGVGLLAVGSAICAVASDLTALLIGRVLLGGATAAILPNASTLLESSNARRPILAAYSAVCTAAASLGPALGGLMAGCGLWRIAFLAIAFGAGATAIFLRPRGPVQAHRQHIDSTIDPPFRRGATILLTLYAFALYGAFFDLLITYPAYLVHDRGFSSAGAGTALLPASLVAIVAGPALMRVLGDWRPAWTLALAATIALIAVVFLAHHPADDRYLPSTLLPVVMLGFGMALASEPMTLAVLDAAGVRRASMAAGLNSAAARLGGAAALACRGHVPFQASSLHPDMAICVPMLGIAIVAALLLARSRVRKRPSVILNRKAFA